VSTFKNLFSSLLNLIGSGKKVKESAIARFTYTVQCIGPDGKEKWSETFQNLVTTAGKTDIIDKYFKASGYTAAWYLGLAGAGTKAVGDTLASHAGWSDVRLFSFAQPRQRLCLADIWSRPR
jgi:hypothetical protein